MKYSTFNLVKRDDVHHHAKMRESLITIVMAGNHEFIKKLRRSTRLRNSFIQKLISKHLFFTDDYQ